MTNQKWVKFNYSYTYKNGEAGTSSAILSDIDISNVASEIKQWIKSWMGKGKVTILDIEVGPYSEDQLTESECSTLCKTYAFNRTL